MPNRYIPLPRHHVRKDELTETRHRAAINGCERDVWFRVKEQSNAIRMV